MAANDLQARFGRRCRSLRQARRLSQLDIVRHWDFSLSHYQKIERGDLDPRLSTLARLAACFEISLSELFEGVSPARPKVASRKGVARPRSRPSRG